MKILRDLSRLDPPGAVAAIGNFDGVHRGHIAVIEAARRMAVAQGSKLAVLTFEPHPREFFRPDAPPFRLMQPATRAHRLEKLGVDILIELPFNADLAAMPAAVFTAEVLVKGLGLSGAVVGADFGYGKGRDGNAETLTAQLAAHGVECEALPLVQGGAAHISSTAIREALSAGQPERAAEMLGHWHRIDGTVAHGEKRGRDLGYPTANLNLDGLHLPRLGIYAVLADVLTGPHQGHYHGVASLGVRPMFGENQPNLETFIFDFEGDLYDAELSVGLVAFLRDEARFDSLDALIEAMDRDTARARALLAGLG